MKVNLTGIDGKCKVVYSEDLLKPLEEYYKEGPDRFYFTEVRGFIHLGNILDHLLLVIKSFSEFRWISSSRYSLYGIKYVVH